MYSSMAIPSIKTNNLLTNDSKQAQSHRLLRPGTIFASASKIVDQEEEYATMAKRPRKMRQLKRVVKMKKYSFPLTSDQ